MPTRLFSAWPFRLGLLIALVLLFSLGQCAVSSAQVIVVPSTGLSSVSVNPGSVVGGSPSVGTVSISALPAGSTALVTLASDNPAVVVPPSVGVGGGGGANASSVAPGLSFVQTTATFTVTTKAVTALTSATITATSKGIVQTTKLILTPPVLVLTSIVVSPSTATLTTGATQTFTAVAKDQNGTALATQPAFTWTTTGVGAVTSAGVYSAGTTAGTATVKAASGTVSGTAAVTVNPVASQAALSLTAAATGSNKVTLYWHGVSGASGYNVYRSATSGGPYTQVAFNVIVPDNGPGLTDAFMYSDVSGLITGTEYFYLVRAIQSGAETIESNEDSTTPDPSAVPWDTSDPAKIISVVNSTAANDLQPDDDGSGGTIPAQVGILFVAAPNGVVYLGNLPNGTPPRAYPASGHVVGNTLVGSDGIVVAISDDDPDVPAPSSTQPASISSLWSDSLMAPSAATPDNYPYQSTPDPSGIYRKVEAVSGFTALDALVGLPNASDPQTVRLIDHPSSIDPAINKPRMSFPTVGDIYSGGVVYLKGKELYHLDAGLQLVPHSDSSVPLEWSPIVYNRQRIIPNDNIKSPETADRIYLDGSIRLPVGQEKNALRYKMVLRGELHMQFLTPQRPSVREQSVRLHYSVAPGGLGTGYIALREYSTIPPYALTSTIVNPNLTLEFFKATEWRKSSSFILKRVNSLAQNLNAPQTNNPSPVPHPGAPQANAPANSQIKGYLADGSYIRSPIGADDFSGAYWGSAYPQSIQLYSPTAGWQIWTDSSNVTLRAGSYPAKDNSGSGAISYIEHNPFFWENRISLNAR